MGTTAIVTDSSSCLTGREAAALGIGVVTLHGTVGDWAFDEADVDPREFSRRLRAGGVTLTSQPTPEEFLAAFHAAAAGGAERVLCLTCAARPGGTHASALLGAGLAGVPVDVVDCRTTSGGLRLLVTELSRVLAAGAPYEEALALVTDLSTRVRSTWSSDTSALLAAGGRAAADLPDGVAVLALDGGGSGGAITVLGAARSDEESVRLQADHLLAAAALAPTRVTVGHGDVSDLADALADALEGAPGVLEVDRYTMAPVVGAHAGAGAFSASYLAAPALPTTGA